MSTTDAPRHTRAPSAETEPDGPRSPLARTLVPVLVTVATLLVVWRVQAVAVRDVTGLVWTDDEMGPLATSRLLAGVGEPLALAHMSYYPLWAVVLVPIWWLTSDPAEAYRLAVTLSALCATLLVLPLAAIARRLRLSTTGAVLVAGVVAVAPGRTVYSGFALIENFLMLVVATALLLGVRYAERRTVGRAVWFGVGAAAMFVAHGRMVGVVGVTVAWFALDAWLSRGERRRAAVVGGLVTVGTALAGYLFHHALAAQLYADASGRESEGLNRILSGELAQALMSALGQVWYAGAAWLGLPVLGAWVVWRLCRREWRERSVGMGAWLAAAALVTYAISVLTWSAPLDREASRLDIISYGRYIEPFLVLLATAGLALLARRRTPPRSALWLAVGVVVGSWVLFSVLVLPGRDPHGWWAPINVPALLGWVWNGDERPQWYLATLWSSVAVVVYLLVRRWLVARRVVVAVVGVLFAIGSVLAQTQYLREWSQSTGRPPGLVGVVEQLDVDAVAYDVAGTDWTGQNLFQFWLLEDHRVDVFDSSLGQAPADDLVIARREWPAAASLGATLVATSERNEALWVLPGELHDELAAEGRLLADPSARVEGFAATAERTDAAAGAPLPPAGGSVDLRVTNTGAAPWPRAEQENEHPVRILLRWPRAGGGVSEQAIGLRTTVLPGTSVWVRVVLAPPPDPAGPARVVVVQEGYGDLGAPLLELAPGRS